MSRNAQRVRQGTILILVAGLSAVLASLALGFLMYARASAETTRVLVQEAQARLMLHAACAYILEASRLGYGQSKAEAERATSAGTGFVTNADGRLMHREGFGWIDVRSADGQPGPLDQLGQPVYRAGIWPAVGGTVVCPMQRWTRPPYALKQTISYNPILADPNRTGDPRWGRPLLLNPDPQPLTPNGWPNPVNDTNWVDYVRGDPRPVVGSADISWFRIHRLSAATFIVTCGAGGTLGFRNWSEVLNASLLPGSLGGPELFNNDPALFELQRSSEIRMWYEIRWSGAVRPLDFRYEEACWWRWLQNAFAYRIYPVNGTQYPGWSRANRFNPNPVGTISFIQRLDAKGDGPQDPRTRLPFVTW